MASIDFADNDVVILSAVRTPMAGFMGEFSALPVSELGGAAIMGALKAADIDSAEIDEVIFGNVLCAGAKQTPVRQAALSAGITQTTPCTAVSKACGSAMKAAILAHDQIRAGSFDTAVAGGMESMTRAPHILPSGRAGIKLAHGEIKDHLLYDGLEDAYTGKTMGAIAQQVADDKELTREEMDAYASQSLTRASTAVECGYFDSEIVPVTVKTRKGDRLVDTDEQPRNAKPEKIPFLKPAFAADGTITAANASSISDGAAALVMVSGAKAKSLGAKPLARIVAHASHAQDPNEFVLAPIQCIKKLLAKTGWDASEVDLYEINEAFAAVVILAAKALGLDQEKVNVNGGACALGYPIGASGTRIIVTLLHALQRAGKSKGVASLCIAGGEASAVAVELL